MTDLYVKILDVIKDRLYDCIVVELDGHLTQIVFAKFDKVEQYLGKTIYLLKENGEDFIIVDDTNSTNVVHDAKVENDDVIVDDYL